MNNPKNTKTGSYYLGFIALGMGAAMLGPTLPSLAEKTNTDLDKMGALFVARAAGYLVGSFLSGNLYDSLRGHPLMGMGLGVIAASLFLTPLIPIFWVLVALFLIFGIGESVLDVGGNTLLVWTHGKDVSPFMNGLHFFFGIGTFIAPLIVARSLLQSGGIVMGYWMAALLVLPLVLIFLRLRSPAIRSQVNDVHGYKPANLPLLALLVGVIFAYAGAEIGFSGWIFTYVTEQNLMSDERGAILTSTFWAAFTLSRLLSIPIAARVPPRYILLADHVLGAISFGVMLLSSHPIALWGGTIGVGVALASIFPTVLSFAERHMSLSGRMTSSFFIGASVGAMIFPWLIGQLFVHVSPQAVLWVPLSMTILGIGLYVAIRAMTINVPQLEAVAAD